NQLNELVALYNGNNWLDESYCNKLSTITEVEAFSKPFAYLHSIAEVVSHVIEWRKELLMRFKFGDPAHLTMDSPDNWISNDILRNEGWKQLQDRLADTQKELLNCLKPKCDRDLTAEWHPGYTYNYLLNGLIQHDLYHLGQIGLIYRIISSQQCR
ncbi:MAG TPA: DinB family protein, partial [Sphingobacteriaceae bacterium]